MSASKKTVHREATNILLTGVGGQGVLAASETKTVQQQLTIHCLTGPLRTFKLHHRIESKDPHIGDPDLANNEQSRWLPSIYVVDNTDVKIISQSLVNPPTQITVSENVDVTLHKVIHNNGPAGPIDVAISSQAIAPSGCSVTAKSVPTSIPQVDVSVDQTVDEIWTIHCGQPSTHSFTFDNSVATILADLFPGNNSASTGLTVDVLAEADVGITGQEVLAGDCAAAAPGEIGVSENTGICLRKTLHNNGSYGPVEVSISTSATAPDDCSAIPDGGNPTSASLPVSTDVVVDEIWTVHCATPSSHSFSFENAIAVTNVHVSDPDPGNNAASTGLTVDAIAQAEVKISNQALVDPPTEIDVSEDVSLTLRKHLHNNGPYGPVEVSISPSASVPLGCTATLENSSGFTSFDYQAASVSANGLVAGFDMDPTDNSCPNDGTDCTLGTIETCVEVSAGDVFQFHVFLDGLPSMNSILGFGYDINSFPGTLTAKVHKSATVNLVAQPGSMILDISEGVPDSSPPYAANVADLGAAEYNPPFTQGVLGRYTLDVTGVAAGVYGMTLSNVIIANEWANELCLLYGCDIWDASFGPQYGLIAVDVDCPTEPEPTPTPTPTTYTLTMAVSPSGGGTTIPPVGSHTYDEDTVVDLTATANAGYTFDSWSGDADCSDGSVTMDANKSCTANFAPIPTPPPGVISLPVSVDTAVDESWTIHCSQPSTHSFSFDNAIAITDAHVSDPEPGNNSASTGLTVDVFVQADVKVVGVTVLSPPAAIDVSEDVDITVRSTLHNNGSYGPVAVEVRQTPTSPADCQISPSEPQTRQVDLPASVDVTVDEPFSIHCSEKSTHTFTFETDIVRAKNPHVVDPNEANNSGSTQLTVEAWGIADLKIVDQQVADAPAEIPVSQDVQITLDEVIHNNGLYGPVDAVAEMTVTIPPDCTVEPTTHIQELYNVPVSTEVVHSSPFTIHCYDVSSHEFVFNSELRLSGTHVRDPNPDNDAASTHLVLASVGHTDIKIVSIGFVNPPTTIPTGQNVDITLRKHIHNNGPWEPVDITIDASATAPTSCTIDPKNVPGSLSAVPVSVDQVVDEVWTVNCSQEGLKTFVFDNSIDVATPHVYDSYPANNSSHKLLTVRNDSYPYWGDEICDGKDNDGDTVIDEGWDLNGNTIADCLDPDLNTDGDEFTNDIDEDDDCDGWSDEDEGFMRTDPLNACPFDENHDAWPPDVNNDGRVNILDVLRYKPVLRGPYDRRYDVNTDGAINILDVLIYKSWIDTFCTPCPS